ncbi:hypothetical protein ACIRQF_07625 [Streptomyces sp. NPDC101191]|uniref:hypothetical protein n=1 Tax=Streptomyces sp. NPDC101191 TaxID=3366126 RepID=UPI00380A8B73
MQGRHARFKSTPSILAARTASASTGAKHARPGGFTTRLRRRLRAYTAVEFCSTHIPGTSGPGEECLLLVNGRQVVGQVRYQFCPTCAYGVITALSIHKPFRDTGLDTRALSHLRSRHPGTTWRSTVRTGTEDDLMLSMRIPVLPSPPPCPHAPALA